MVKEGEEVKKPFSHFTFHLSLVSVHWSLITGYESRSPGPWMTRVGQCNATPDLRIGGLKKDNYEKDNSDSFAYYGVFCF
jgi:hypothetical protein